MATAELALSLRRRASSLAVRRLVLAGLPLASGAALVGYIVMRLPMPLAGLITAGGGIAIWLAVLPRMPASARQVVRARVRTGIRAGIPAVIAYDTARFGLVALASMSFQPFRVWPLFGHALLGPGVSEPLATAAGLAFHTTNGIGFAIAFVLAVPHPTWRRGIGWALVLEAAMLALYPGWLGISLASELVPVSLVGHVAYGAVLGDIASRREGAS